MGVNDAPRADEKSLLKFSEAVGIDPQLSLNVRKAKQRTCWQYVYPIALGGALICAIAFRGAVLGQWIGRPCSGGASFQKPMHQLSKYAVGAAAIPLLQDLQVYPPVLTPTHEGLAFTNGSAEVSQASLAGATSGCVRTQTLLDDYVFANSYGAPFIRTYTPPTDCRFNRITFNITVLSAGVQFDRLGIVYFGDTEIWRTSTAEPKQTGITWTYIKDMSQYLSLFKTEQKLIFDLGNVVDSTYTGSYNTTLTASFFQSEDTVVPADLIIPVSTGQAASNQSSSFTYPSQDPVNNLTLPRNTKKAVFTIAATGQIAEEFWYSNVLESDVDTFGAGFLYGFSPFREVQLYIDGMLAGVVWPFPIIFTGGVVPGLWRPIVGIDAFDLREDEIDITPWLPLLCDGKSHSFEILMAGIADDGNGNGQISNTIGSYWIITGKAFIWLDTAGSITTGSTIKRSVPSPGIQLKSHVGQDRNGTNETLSYSVDVQRQLKISSTVKTSTGSNETTWAQTLTYTNRGDFKDYGNLEVNTQLTNGLDVASTGYARKISYPIFLNSTFISYPNQSYLIDATVERGQDIYVAGQPVFPTGQQSFGALARDHSTTNYQGSHLSTTQNGTAFYFNNVTSATSSGSTEQDMTFTGFQVDTISGGSFPGLQGSRELYEREVSAVGGVVVSDHEELVGEPIVDFSRGAPAVATKASFASGSVRKVLGRGPGTSNTT